MVEMIKLERLQFEAQLANMLRPEEDGGNIIETDHSKRDQKRKNGMDKKVGMWIDRNKAVIVSIANNIEAKRIITSDMEHYVLYSTVVPGDGSPQNPRDQRFWNHLGEYYDKIITYIRDATEIQIFGPEGAKYELQKRLEDEGLAARIVSVEDVGKLTDLEIATRVQKRFPSHSRFDFS